MIARQVDHVVAELAAVGHPADLVDPAERMLQLDLRHHHRRQVDQRRHLGGRRLARLGAEHAERAEPEAVAGDQRCPGIESRTGTTEHAVGVAGVGGHVLDHQRFCGFRDTRARRLVARDAVMRDADARLEPLPVAIGQRHRGDGQAEDLAGHPRDPVEALARRRIQQFQLVQRIQACVFLLVDDGDSLRACCIPNNC
jgi:hypothetical protein